MIYKFPNQTDEDFIPDVLKVDASVFEPCNQGTDESIRARFCVNRESFVLAYDMSKLIGYVAFFPITSELSEKIQGEDKSFDDDIRPEDILPSYEGGTDIDIFLISAAILPEYQGRGIGAELMKKSIAFLSEKRQNGCRLKNAYSYAYTEAGARLLGRAGFAEIKKATDIKSGHTVKLMLYSFDATNAGK